MVSFPAQDTTQQVPVQLAPTFTSSPAQQQPPNKKSFRTFLNISSWIVLFALLPVTVLIFLSQDSIPGDFFYPVKRGMENVILAAASVNPATKAAFRTDLTETRFKEAQSLVVSKSNTSGLTTFVDEVQGTQLEVASLKDDTQRTKAEEKLISKIEEYQTGLSTLQSKTEQTIVAYQSQGIPTPSFTPAPTLIPTLTPTPLPSFKVQPTPTLTPVSTVTLAPTTVPTVPPQPENTKFSEQKKIAQTLKETKEKLDKIKKDLEEKRNESKEKHEERNESEQK